MRRVYDPEHRDAYTERSQIAHCGPSSTIGLAMRTAGQPTTTTTEP